MEHPRLAFNIDEFAAAVGISRSQTYIEISRGRLNTAKIGNFYENIACAVSDLSYAAHYLASCQPAGSIESHAAKDLMRAIPSIIEAQARLKTKAMCHAPTEK